MRKGYMKNMWMLVLMSVMLGQGVVASTPGTSGALPEMAPVGIPSPGSTPGKVAGRIGGFFGRSPKQDSLMDLSKKTTQDIFSDSGLAPSILKKSALNEQNPQRKALYAGMALYREQNPRTKQLTFQDEQQLQAIPGAVAVLNIANITAKKTLGKNTERVRQFEALSFDTVAARSAPSVSDTGMTLASTSPSPASSGGGTAGAGGPGGGPAGAGTGAGGGPAVAAPQTPVRVHDSSNIRGADSDDFENMAAHLSSRNQHSGAPQAAGAPAGPLVEERATTPPPVTDPAAPLVGDDPATDPQRQPIVPASVEPKNYKAAFGFAVPAAIVGAIWVWLAATKQGRELLGSMRKLFTKKGRASLTPQQKREAIEDLVTLAVTSGLGVASGGYALYSARKTYTHNRNLPRARRRPARAH
jgi:hypothetical protein